VRAELDSHAGSPFTRVIVALSEARPYRLAAEGNRIVLSVLPAEGASSRKKRDGPVAAASAPLIGRLHRTQPPRTRQTHPSAIVPPAALPRLHSQRGGRVPPRITPERILLEPLPRRNRANPVRPRSRRRPKSQVWSLSAGASETTADAQSAAALQQANPDVRIAYRIKYVAEGVAYLEVSQRWAAEGMKLDVKALDPSPSRPPPKTRTRRSSRNSRWLRSPCLLRSARSTIHPSRGRG